MTLLAIDTSASVCAAGVFNGGTELSRQVIDLDKGHAEHLMAVIAGALDAAGTSYADIDRIVVAVGPGSFTGIRVGVAAARGLALALSVPAVGVSNLEAVAAEVGARHSGRAVMAAFLSARGAVQAAIYDPFAKPVYHPEIMTAAEAARLAVAHNAVVTGSAAPEIAGLESSLIVDGLDVTADIATYARIGAARRPDGKPTPLYLREPDAKPQAGFAVARTPS